VFVQRPHDQVRAEITIGDMRVAVACEITGANNTS
jgi:hypothetical protein